MMAQFSPHQRKQLEGVPQHHHSFRDEETRDGGPKFDPPVFMQRYRRATHYIEGFPGDKTLKIVDFGCAEMGFVIYAKVLKRVSEIVCVDLDYDQLQQHAYQAAPQDTDFALKRPNPLRVRVMCGSVIEWDDVLAGADVVTAIELIEHLHPPVLAEFPRAVFGKIKPKMAVITTPNADFNCLFPNFSQFRHSDHKFEWTRKEFEEWCNTNAEKYGYSCEFSGVGEPGGSGNLTDHGYCSQVAVFRRKDILEPEQDDGVPVAAFQGLKIRRERKYSVVADYSFPYLDGDGDENDAEKKDRAVSVLEAALLEAAAHWPEYKRGEVVYVHASRAITKLKSQELLKCAREMNPRELLESFGYEVTSTPPPDAANAVPLHILGDKGLGDFYVGIVKPRPTEEESAVALEEGSVGPPQPSTVSISQPSNMPGPVGNMMPVVYSQPPFVPFAAALSWNFGNANLPQPSNSEEGSVVGRNASNSGPQYQQSECNENPPQQAHAGPPTPCNFNLANSYQAVPFYYFNAFPFSTYSCAMVPNAVSFRCPLPPYFPMSHIYQQYPRLVFTNLGNRPRAPGNPNQGQGTAPMGSPGNNVMMMPSAVQPNGPRHRHPGVNVTGAAAGAALPMPTFRHTLPAFVRLPAVPTSAAGNNQQGVFVGASV